MPTKKYSKIQCNKFANFNLSTHKFICVRKLIFNLKAL